MVDPAGAVLDIVTRERMRAEVLRHRCAYVAVLVASADSFDREHAGPASNLSSISASTPWPTEDTEVVVHQRADWKDTYPSYWDLAFGGVCGVGEDWPIAAERELHEEAGIAGAALRDLGSCEYDTEANRIVGRVLVTAWPDEPTCNDGEVVALDRVRLGDLRRWTTGRPVCPDSAELVVPKLAALVEGRG